MLTLGHLLVADSGGKPIRLDARRRRSCQIKLIRPEEPSILWVGERLPMYHSLRDELLERFAINVYTFCPCVRGREKLGDESRIEKMQDSMFHSTNVEIYRHTLVGFVRVQQGSFVP
jgi:hypothetical protein